MSSKDKNKPFRLNEFIDDEAELSGDDDISEDELDASDADEDDLELVDKEAPELDSEEEEEVRGLYQKQLETEDKRAVLLLQEHLEDKNVGIGQRRRRKFRWQTQELMENSLRRHYDPDDDDSEDEEDDLDDEYYEEMKPKLKRPPASIFMSSDSMTAPPTSAPLPVAGTSNGVTITGTTVTSNLNRFLFRDKEVVEALSTKETIMTTRDERDKVVDRELKRVLQSKSIFDQLYN